MRVIASSRSTRSPIGRPGAVVSRLRRRQAARARARAGRRAAADAQGTGGAAASCRVRARSHGRRGLWPDPAAGSARHPAARLSQHPRFAAAALARCGTDPACRAGGRSRTGISIMLMDAGLDTGPELLRRELAIGPRETGGELHDRLAPLGAEAIVAAVQGWAVGSIRADAATCGRRHLCGEDPQGRGAHRLVEIRRRNRSPGARVQSVARRGDAARRCAGAYLGGAPGDRGIRRPARRCCRAPSCRPPPAASSSPPATACSSC